MARWKWKPSWFSWLQGVIPNSWWNAKVEKFNLAENWCLEDYLYILSYWVLVTFQRRFCQTSGGVMWILEAFTLRYSNIAMKNSPLWRCISSSKWNLFQPAMLVYQSVLVLSDAGFFFRRCAGCKGATACLRVLHSPFWIHSLPARSEGEGMDQQKTQTRKGGNRFSG